MMNTFRTWILSLTGASIIASAAKRLTPPGSVRKVTSFVCGVMLAGILLRPILILDRDELALALSEYHSSSAEIVGDWETKENELLRPFIEERCRAYILDEAKSLGLTGLDCAVHLKWRDESWVPYEITLKGNASDPQKKRLGERLDAALGVPKERQYWDAEQ